MSKLTVAAFDFDGTLTYRDSLIPFLIFNNGFLKTTLHCFAAAPTAISFILGMKSRQQVKESLLTNSLKGVSIETINKNGKAYAQKYIQKLLRPEAMQRLQWHKKQNHRCILISANLDTYLIPWARQEGFNDIICSKLESNGNGLVTGKLVGLNCWGPEKKKRLEDMLGPKHSYILYAYGDSRGDYDLLTLADYPFYRKFANGSQEHE